MSPVSVGKADFLAIARKIFGKPAKVAAFFAACVLITELAMDGQARRLFLAGGIFAILFVAGVIVELWHERRG